MAEIFGENFSREKLLKRVGDISQICGTKLYEFIDGPGKGMRGIDFSTGAGLEFTVVVDRCMDISRAAYQQVPLCWRSAVREIHPAFYEPEGEAWLRTFFGGLLTTCGLCHAGPPWQGKDAQFGLHGRISTIPASLIALESRWEKDDYIMSAKGQVDEVSVYGDKLRLTRTIGTKLGSDKLWINDSIENIGSKKSPLMLVYHINLGFPVIDPSSRLISSSASVLPLEKNAESDPANYGKFTDPVAGIEEKCYMHEVKADENGCALVAIVNDGFNQGRGIGCYTKFSVKNLPRFIEWKMMGQGEYVVGTEPTNLATLNSDENRKPANLVELEPGQVIENSLEIGALGSGKEISAFEKEVKKVLAR